MNTPSDLLFVKSKTLGIIKVTSVAKKINAREKKVTKVTTGIDKCISKTAFRKWFSLLGKTLRFVANRFDVTPNEVADMY